MKLELRPAQAQVLADVSAAWRAGHKRVLVSAACGFGKSECATAILQATHNNGKRGAFIADRRALVEQIVERFDKYELPCGVLMADHPRFRPSSLIQACSAQTLARRRWPDVNLIVVDECHVMTETVKKKLEARDCYAIGLSATAITKGLGKYFDAVVNAPTTNQLIEQKLLVGFDVLEGRSPDMAGVPVNSMGEWDEKETEKRALEVVGDVVAEYLQHANGEQFIGFAHSIAHAQELQRQFIAAGINVATYTADDRPEDRSEIVQEFKRPDSRIRGILSIEALTRGFDAPHVRVLIMARPLRNAAHVFIQMLGRVMRTSDGKGSALVLDHANNTRRFWKVWRHLFEHGVTELDMGEKKPKEKPEDKEPEPLSCPNCKTLHAPRPTCPKCGFEYPKRATIEHVPGSLVELIASQDANRLRAKLWPQVVWHVLQSTQDMEKAQRRAQAIYRDLTGEFARARIETTVPEPASTEVRNKIRAGQIRYAKGRAKANQGEARA